MIAALVLAAALLHAAWNALLKSARNRVRSLVVNRLAATCVGAFLLLYLPPLDAQAWFYVITAALVHLIYFFALLSAYQYGDFSQVYPISRGTAPLLILLFSIAFGVDTLSLIDAFGIVLVSIGIIFLARTRSISHAVYKNRALGFAFLTAFCIAGYTLFSGAGVRISGNWLTYAATLEVVSGAIFLITASMFKRKDVFAKGYTLAEWRTDALSGVLAVVGFGIALWAMNSMSIASVAALRETSVVFATLIAYVFLKEKYATKRIIASMIVVAGVSLILL